ncbi:MAG: ABC transporter permease [Leptospira sp.]|nr:ABC transporter permease [Leptospira sp.]
MQAYTRILALFKREFTLMFNTALGYTFIVLFMFVESMIFFFGASGNSFWDRKSSDLGFFFTITPYLLLILVPAMGMKIWAEEKEAGTWEILFTLPFQDWEIILGKFFASAIYLIICLFSTLLLPLTTLIFGNPDFGLILSGYMGVYLLGLTFLSIVIYVSIYVNSQIGAFIISFFVISVFYLFGLQKLIDVIGENIFQFISIFSIPKHFESFYLGIIDIRDFYFFFSVNILFLTFATFALKGKR